jgi:long-chain fatty acid transport protein
MAHCKLSGRQRLILTHPGTPQPKVRLCLFLGFALALLAGLAGSPEKAAAAGFALMNQGTAAMAQGNAFVADASDASAVFYNPAGLSQIKRPQVYVGSFLYAPDREYEGGGVSAETNHRLSKSLTVYVALPVHERVAIGLGFFSPFGLSTVWQPEWAGRYISTYSELKTYTFNPAVSIKPLDNLSLAAGFNLMWSDVRLKRKTQTFVLGRQLNDGELTISGHGQGYGFNLGGLWEPVPGVKLGAAYRSDIYVNHQGDASINNPYPLRSPTHSAGSASMNYPASASFGINYQRLKPLSLEFDASWTGWSSYQQYKVKLNRWFGTVNRLAVQKNYNDSWAFRFGANYALREDMILRAGYVYDLTPVPDETFDPQLPDANRHIFCLGGDLKVWRFTLGIAYNYILLENRSKNNTIYFNNIPAPLQANGRYSGDVHSLGLSASFQF